MKIVKNIAILAFATSFMFAGIGFHYANNYTDMDTGTNTNTSWGATYALNDNTSVGWDSVMGMLMNFDAPMGVSLRLGWTASTADDCSDSLEFGLSYTNDVDCLANADNEGDMGAGVWTAGNPAGTSIGLGYTWWTGGEGVKTSIRTNYDYVMAPGAGAPDVDLDPLQEENSSNLSVVVGFGF